MVGAGGAVHGHPMGAKAGAKGLRQAIDAAVNNIPVEEAAKEHPELARALEAWGVSKVGEKGRCYDLMES